MTVPFSNYTSLYFDTGKIAQSNGSSDAYYQPVGGSGVPELKINIPYSLDITDPNATEQQCLAAITHDPTFSPITAFHKGLLICIQTGNGVALIEQTKNLDQSNTLYLHEVYWLNSSQ